MSTLQEKLAKLRSFNASVRGSDPTLAEETLDFAARPEVMAEAVRERVRPESLEESVELESIVLRRTRPVLAIRENKTVLEFADAADSAIWKVRLLAAAPFLETAARAVGRINLEGAPLDWVGTGWLVSDNILVTNRHVAQEFAARNGRGFSFLMGDDGAIRPSVDFLQEIDNPKALTFRLKRALHIEASPGPDVAFFEVEVTGGNPALAKPIQLASQVVQTANAAVIGYPAFDSRIPEPDLMERIYGSVYNKKRLAPGGVTRIESTRLLHDCTTLGGNSGSAVIHLDSGKALGLHFSGSFLASNFAVRADVVSRLLRDVKSGRKQVVVSKPASAPRAVRLPEREQATLQAGLVIGKLQIPLEVTVTVGKGRGLGAPPAAFPVGDGSALGDDIADDEDDSSGDEVEAVAADYRDRKGYQPGFIGDGFEVPLPVVTRNVQDVLEFEFEGKKETELRYQHFTVVMNKKRRLCIYSAVNIDGKLSKKSKRVEWKFDPRLPREMQIKNECYGNPPKFSRGHMTRREDPGWGTAANAKRGNEDSMHVTNAAPQMQAFNSPIWLGLEDYALQNAREDDMKISVITGPYLKRNDPVRFGVRVPVSFWKIIVFIHDETGELCATGYEMSQKQSLPPPEEEFVFGQFTSQQLGITTQVPIRSIAERAGLDFGVLAEIDPLASDEESVDGGAAAGVPLAALESIRFVR